MENKTVAHGKRIIKLKENVAIMHDSIKIELSNIDNISILMENTNKLWCLFLLYDPNGNLRAQRMPSGDSVQIYIDKSQEFSSPYCISGAFPDGLWNVEFHASIPEGHEVGADLISFELFTNVENKEIRNTDEIWNENSGEDFLSKEFFANKIQNTKKDWYAGDFHTHTIFSDGQMSREENNEMAIKQGLDFFVATDHHTVPISWPKHDNVVAFPGVEFTSALGHMNILFAEESPFKEGYFAIQDESKGLEKIVSEIPKSSIRSINHPFLKPWSWVDMDFNLNDFDSMEVINDPSYRDSAEALEETVRLWDVLLMDCHKITGIGGSDSHLRPDDKYPDADEPSLIGDPATYVFAENLSSKALVNGIKNNHVVVSRNGFIDFNVSGSIAGETCLLYKGNAQVKIKTPLKIEWVVDGKIVQEESGVESSFDYDLTEGYHYIRVNVRNEKGYICGFSNPVFFGAKQSTLTTWGEVLEQMENKI